jgi:16S rRNA (cytosine967-C5)-methyltransferase
MNARQLALVIINEVDLQGAYANIALAHEINRQALSDQDRRLVTELVYGTIKAGATIDWLIAQYTDRPLKKIAPVIRNILRLGTYQIFFLTRIPASAAVNESVKLAKNYGAFKSLFKIFS